MTRVIVLLSLLIAGCGSKGVHAPFLGEDTPPPENAVVLPPYPQEQDLLEFPVGPVGSHRYFIDKQSLTVGTDRIVRYTIVVRTAGGAVNTTYEGIRCAPAEKRIYAVGRSGGTWVEAKASQWSAIRPWAATEYQAALHADYFCPNRLIVRSKDEALNVLLRSAPRSPTLIK